jgi:hypothetical protein
MTLVLLTARSAVSVTGALSATFPVTPGVATGEVVGGIVAVHAVNATMNVTTNVNAGTRAFSSFGMNKIILSSLLVNKRLLCVANVV